MNLHSIFEKLDRLYAPDENEKVTDEVNAKNANSKEHMNDKLTEAAEDEIVTENDEIIIVDDEIEDGADELEAEDSEGLETETQFVLECENCGGLTIRLEADIDAEEECQYCGETVGNKILGTLIPYEAEEAAETEEE